MRNQDPLEIVKDLWRSRRVKLLVILFGLLLLSGFGACTFRVCCVTFVDNYAIPYKFDTRTGEITKLDRVGYHIRTPLVEKIHSVDARPVQACVSAIQRVLNCKLVRFNEEGLDLFLEWHGRKNYSNDGGTPAAPSELNQTLKAYAYEGSNREYPFLTIIRELNPNEFLLPGEETTVVPGAQR